MKLKSILKTLSAERLTTIQDYWGITPVDLSDCSSEEERCEALVLNLYQRLQNRSLWEKVAEQMTQEEQNLVSFLAIHGGDLDYQEVAARFFDGDGKRLEEVVSSMAERGIVFMDEVPGINTKLVLVGIPEPFLRYIELPSFWEGYVGYFLKEMTNNELKHVATQGLKLQPESANKNYLIWLLRTNLLDPKFLRKYLERLAPGANSVFDMLMERKGSCVYRDLLELNVQRRYDHSRGDAIQWLLQSSGLVFTAIPGGNKYNSLLMIPRDVAYILTNHYKEDTRSFHELDSVSVVKKENTPSMVMDNSNTVLRDLVVLCGFMDRYPVKVLATGGIGKNDLKKVLPMLSRFKTLKYAEFLSLFAVQKKFLVSNGETYNVSNNFLEWLQDSRAAYSELLSWWLKTTEWNEEYLEGNTVHVDPIPSGLASIVSFRRTVINSMNEMPRDRWCVFDGFYSEVEPTIEQEIPGRNKPMAYDKHTRSNALVVESIVGETMHWLGLLAIGLQSDKDVDGIGFRRGDGKTMKARGGSRGRPRKQHEVEFTFRFTDLGRFVFESHPDHWSEVFRGRDENVVIPIRNDTEHFIVQPTHEVIVPPDLSLKTFYHLNEIAEIKSIDVMSILSITKDSLREGLDKGLRGEEIIEFLKNGSRTPIPESLTQLINECAEKHGEVNMGYAGGYIVVDDKPLLAQIRANRKINPSIKDIVDERVVILNSDVELKKLARELQRVGFMPRLASEHVHIKEDDMFHLSMTREDMYTLIAAVRYTMECRDQKGIPVAEERLSPLLERLKPDSRTFAALDDLAEPLVRTWIKASETAMESKMKQVHDRFESQITKIVSSSVPRGVSKHHFDGPNPSEDEDDIERMLEFAVENEFEVEIHYVKSNREEVSEIVAPETVERDRLLGRCRSRDNSFAVYKIDRITQAKLV